MRIPSYYDRNDLRENPEMTPMIDIVFLLLIFFVCTSTSGLVESLFGSQLATGAVESLEPVAPEEKPWATEVWLRLRHTNQAEPTTVSLNEREYDDFREVEAQLRALADVAPDSPVILDIGPEVPLEDLIRTWDTCRAAKFQSIQFAADPGTLARPAGKR